MLALLATMLVMAAVALGQQPRAERRAIAVARGTPRTTMRESGVRAWSFLRSRLVVGPAARRRDAATRTRALQALAALAAELDAGQPPAVALAQCGGDPCVWPAAVTAARLGGDVSDALLLDARQHPVLSPLSACWRVAASSGVGLAASTRRLAASARAAEDVRVDLEGQLAGPRATARMLAVLPAVGILLGLLLGADPLAWLLATSVGHACLLGGVVLTGIGMWWTGRIAARVERLL